MKQHPITNIKPIAVLISDLHFNLNTLLLASECLQTALNQAAKLQVPTVIAGDLHDTKDIIRGKVANTLILLLKQAKTPVYILVGNHDLLNEKSSEHGLNYLIPYAKIIDVPYYSLEMNLFLLPYYNNQPMLLEYLKKIPKNSTVIMHQGFLGAKMGDYVQDKTSIDVSSVKDFRVYSGHYHRHQTLGTITYIGSSYTVTFGEANDGPKGFLILNEDRTFTREILKLRKHIIFNSELIYNPETEIFGFDKNIDQLETKPEDLIWLKITGPESELKKINKKELGQKLFGHSNFQLDLIINDSIDLTKEKLQIKSASETLDEIIDASGDTEKQKQYLKELHRELTES